MNYFANILNIPLQFIVSGYTQYCK